MRRGRRLRASDGPGKMVLGSLAAVTAAWGISWWFNRHAPQGTAVNTAPGYTGPQGSPYTPVGTGTSHGYPGVPGVGPAPGVGKRDAWILQDIAQAGDVLHQLGI